MSDFTRREFAEALALAALAPMLGGEIAPIRLPEFAAGAAAEAEPAALARALADAIRAQYGHRLSDADLTVITRQIEASLDRSAKVRKVPLSNGDEPDFVFSAVRTPDSA
jgi:hypothetical protein